MTPAPSSGALYLRLLSYVRPYLKVFALAVLLLSLGAAAQTAAFAKITQKKGAFEDVRQDVADAIVARGFVIDYTARIGEMLSRTAKDVGATTEVYKSAVAMQFCSAKLSRDMFEADPATIAFCPYVIAVYELTAKPGIVHIAYRRFPSIASRPTRKTVAAVQRTLDEIIAKAAK